VVDRRRRWPGLLRSLLSLVGPAAAQVIADPLQIGRQRPATRSPVGAVVITGAGHAAPPFAFRVAFSSGSVASMFTMCGEPLRAANTASPMQRVISSLAW